MPKRTTMIFPGRFDPITLGHEDIARRASLLCERLVVAVSTQPAGRDFLFDLPTRMQMCTDVFSGVENITVVALEGLLVDLGKTHQACAVVKGLRDAADCPREMRMAQVNQRLHAGIETLFMFSSIEQACISSTLVRELMGYQNADLTSFVRPVVARQLHQRR